MNKTGEVDYILVLSGEAHPPRDQERRLRAFVTRVLADAAAAGFRIDDVMAALRAQRQGGA